MKLTKKQKDDIGKGIYRINEGTGAPEAGIKIQPEQNETVKIKKNRTVDFYLEYPEFFNPT